MFLLQTPLSMRIPSSFLVLIGLGLVIGLAQPARALVVTCNSAGSCMVARSAAGMGESSLNLQLTGSLSSGTWNSVSVLSTDIDDLLQAASTNGICRSENMRSICVSPSMRVTQHRRLGVRIQFRSGAQVDDWRFGDDRIAPSPVVSHPGGITNPIPEPSAALIFGVGLLVASGLVMGTGSLE